MYFGWNIVIMSAVVYMIAIGTTFNAVGLFVLPVSKEFGLSRADMNTALILLNFGNAAVAPFIGRLLDRVPARRIMLASAITFGLALAGLGLSRSLALSAAIIFVPLAAAMAGAGTITASALLARWFTRRRGKAMTLAIIGMSASGILVTPVISWLLESQGWRSALVTIGIAAGLILLAIALLTRERPTGEEALVEQVATPALSPLAKEGPAPIGALLRMPQFWSIGLSAALAMGISQAITISLVPLALESGTTMLQATSLISIAGGAAIAAKLGMSLIADRVDRIVLLSLLFAVGAVINAALLASEGYWQVAGCAALLGVGVGTIPPIFFSLVADRFGVASFGTARGLMAPVTAVIGAIVVRFAGEVYDRTGGYSTLFATFIVASLIAAALMLATRFTRPFAGAAALPATAH